MAFLSPGDLPRGPPWPQPALALQNPGQALQPESTQLTAKPLPSETETAELQELFRGRVLEYSLSFIQKTLLALASG